MHKLYHELAYLWPMLSPPEDYEPEAIAIQSVIDRFLKSDPQGKPLLVEMGAGGGHTLSHLTEYFDCTAVDIADPMLVNCSLVCPDAKTINGDMRTVELGKPMDIVLIHDAVDYMQTPEDAKAAINNAAKQLKPGGLLIVAPTYTTESFEDDQSISDEHEDKQFKVAFTSKVIRATDNKNQFLMQMVFDITEDGRKASYTDEHRCGLFGEFEWLGWMREAGLKVHLVDEIEELDDMPWHGFVGIK
ncbi:MAG: methyltransferase domain-containing protein [Phycisphaeraceae bacterium JB051]